MKETSAGSILQNIVGKEKMQEICELLGGLKIYIPNKPLPLQRDSIIKNEYEQLVASGKQDGCVQASCKKLCSFRTQNYANCQ